MAQEISGLRQRGRDILARLDGDMYIIREI